MGTLLHFESPEGSVMADDYMATPLVCPNSIEFRVDGGYFIAEMKRVLCNRAENPGTRSASIFSPACPQTAPALVAPPAFRNT